MKTRCIYLLILLLPLVCPAQQQPVQHTKTVAAGGTHLHVHDAGITFGTHPIFLVPADTLGRLSVTAIISGVRIIGMMAPISCKVDTMGYITDPATEKAILVCDSIYIAEKQGEWIYDCGDGLRYHEYYDKGQLLRRDSLSGTFSRGGRQISITDSMARTRSILDLYLKKGGD